MGTSKHHLDAAMYRDDQATAIQAAAEGPSGLFMLRTLTESEEDFAHLRDDLERPGWLAHPPVGGEK